MAEATKQSGAVPTVVRVGLVGGLAEELGKALSREGCTVWLEPLAPRDQALRLIETDADVVFCPAEPEQYAPLLEAMKAKRPGLPVVVVSRLPEVSAWLDALERGAMDYCAPPFESAQIHWVLQSALKAATF
jgi:DNA-binding NtrC family response regulator